MFEMNVPKYFWSDGVLPAAYLINKILSRTLEGRKSPIEVLFPSLPAFPVPLMVFGCTFFVHIPKRDKLDLKDVKCVSSWDILVIGKIINAMLHERKANYDAQIRHGYSRDTPCTWQESGHGFYIEIV